MNGSVAARCRAAGRYRRYRRFRRADEAADELAFNLSCNCVDVDAFGAEKGPSGFDVVHARWFDVDGTETSPCALGYVVIIFERARDAAHPEQHPPAHLIGYLCPHHHIRDSE